MQVQMGQDDKAEGAVAVGEHVAAVEHALEELVACVERSDYSHPVIFAALRYLDSARAVLQAGVEAVPGLTAE
ncbi:hypothetical protein [Frigoriglobus tundricola]|uniref:Uncharacterized protein n=1 Tax=Frigoriglobus tundricola TaxID=2774151 RepID=A0A6M5Z793_9BACT|nr:hypothetical protein [Frigoriglobus tundricola]QJX01254.1 hypothetical protein FTUN_8893 [Frigoriglobus tundricola]